MDTGKRWRGGSPESEYNEQGQRIAFGDLRAQIVPRDPKYLYVRVPWDDKNPDFDPDDEDTWMGVYM